MFFFEILLFVVWNLNFIVGFGFIFGIGQIFGVECVIFGYDFLVCVGVFNDFNVKKLMCGFEIVCENCLFYVQFVELVGVDLCGDGGGDFEVVMKCDIDYFVELGCFFYEIFEFLKLCILMVLLVFGSLMVGGVY